MNYPEIRKANIVVQEFENELLIYDLSNNKAFCLNETSAMVWQLCDGKKTAAEISKLLSQKLKIEVSEGFIWLTLDQLKRNNLLDKTEALKIDFDDFSRREMLKKVGYASLLALPLIVSVAAPKAIQAASDLCAGMNCNDNNACTIDFCNPANGQCQHFPRVCDDNNICTDNSCDPQIGCVFTPNNVC